MSLDCLHIDRIACPQPCPICVHTTYSIQPLLSIEFLIKQVDLRASIYMDRAPYTFLVGTCVSCLVHFLIFVFVSEMACLTGTEDGN